ncbi:MAG: HAD family phosphatase [Bacteroidia bacterium]|nr:HAD family phosphatase [Bacteroidia bacterium]NNF31357.1 HAD family phosphatase [Flavobacteriaceae bacterium]MBT8276567.1 HAD family phosphatase [Bacteroidia bacterium]NNJ82861.1 HAD family phosphatase [Flavobacteriaceae bacterium]NNK54369.1 HAD family phosphatase [Flavobacteriaceae bacterium]
MERPVSTIIFDLGGVLIDWNPEYVFLKEFRGNREKMDWFLNEICAWDWNANQDAGYPLARATEDRIAMFPEFEELIRMYYGRWDEMLGFAHDDTLEILESVVNNPDYRVLALTNWSGETFPNAIAKFDWLQWFEGILVSGNEGMRKPFPEIYELMLSRYQINPAEAVFIDDSIKNVEGSKLVGIRGIHFTGASNLIRSFDDLGIRI